MPNPYFQFKQFRIDHDRCAMKVTTDACLFGAWCARQLAEAPASDGRMLDIGAGTGLLSLMVAQKNPLPIDAVEIDASAAAQASENVADSPWRGQVNVIAGDVLQLSPGYCYSRIVSNPPFYQNDLRSSRLAKNIAHHDGGLKLDELLGVIARLLCPDGAAFLLLPAKRETDVLRQAADCGLYLVEVVRVKQSVNHSPFRVMTKVGFAKAEAQISELAINDEKDRYTPAFVALLSDYYLYL